MSDVLQRLYELDKSFAPKLEDFLQNNENVEGLQRLPKKELIQLVNYLNDTLNRFTYIGVPSRKCLLVLRKICGARKVLPTAYDVPGTISFSSRDPFVYGGSCDAYKGTLSTMKGVCIKKIRISSKNNQDKIKELFCREAVVWKRLDHPNVMVLKGITLDPLQLVSEWMPGGELREYIKKNPDTNHINLLIGIAEGLAYLHSCSVVHGDLKGPNIVVDGSGNARITDFGLASIIRAPNSVASASGDHGFTPRWTAPEILQDGIPANKESDIFSFGMVIYEVFSGKIPFHNETVQAAQASIMYGRRPPRPDHPELTDALWELAERCWAATVQDRQDIEEVVEVLKRINSDKIAQITKPPSTKLEPRDHGTQKKSKDGGGDVAVPYDVETSPPVPIPPPPNARGSRHPAHRSVQVIGSGTTNQPSPTPPPSAGNKDPLAAGSTAGIVTERGPLKAERDTRGFKKKDVGGPKEEDGGRGNQGNAAEHVVKREKDGKAPKLTESTTPALTKTKATYNPSPATRKTPPDTGNNNVAGSSGFVDDPNENLLSTPSPGSGLDDDTTPTARPPAKQQVDQPGDQTPKHPGVQPGQPPADNPRNTLAGQGQGRMADTRAAASRLPASIIATKLGESNAPQRGEVPTAPPQRESALQQRESAVQKRESDVQQRESAVQQRESAVQKRESGAQQRGSDMQQRESAVQKRESDVQQQESDVQQQESDVQRRESEVQRRESEVQQRESVVQQRESAVQQRETLAQQQREALVQQREKRKSKFLCC